MSKKTGQLDVFSTAIQMCECDHDGRYHVWANGSDTYCIARVKGPGNCSCQNFKLKANEWKSILKAARRA